MAKEKDKEREKQEVVMKSMAYLKLAFEMKHNRYHGFDLLVDQAMKELNMDPVELDKYIESNRDVLEKVVKEKGYHKP